MQPYIVLKKLGSGTYGDVSCLRSLKNGKRYAMKRIRLRGPTYFSTMISRELNSLSSCRNPHVIFFYDMIASKGGLCMVTEFANTDLESLMFGSQKPLIDTSISRLITMLLKGVYHCHSKNIIHRDLKPSNLLLSKSGVLKLADFGQSRIHNNRTELRTYTHQVATRWYRAPELLFGSTAYDYCVDMWSVGVILAELVNLTPFFPGENDIHQIYRHVQILGNPTEWPQAKYLPDYNKISFPNFPRVAFNTLFRESPIATIRLLNGLLAFNPSKRLSALSALSVAQAYQICSSFREKCFLKRGAHDSKIPSAFTTFLSVNKNYTLLSY
jgi:cell cycle related kinase